MGICHHRRLAPLTALAFLLAGCATSHVRGDLADSANSLDLSSRMLASHADAETPSYDLDAHALSHEASEFRSLVGSGADASQLRGQFDRVRTTYHAVQADVSHLNMQVGFDDLRPVTVAYRQIEDELGYPGEHHAAVD